MEETSVVRTGDLSAPLATQMVRAFDGALALQSEVPEWVLQIHGMSGRLYRRFINNLVRSQVDARYLEIGSWAGSTACAAMVGNKTKITCIDNWSEFGGPKEAFITATNAARSPDVNFTFIEKDFRTVDYAGLGKFNIYLFDGPHTYQDQYDGIAAAQPALEREYIQIVDDWNWPQVRDGTMQALHDQAVEVVAKIEVRTTQDDSHPKLAQMENSAWHNGYLMALVRKG